MLITICTTVLVTIVVYRLLCQLFLPLRGVPEPKGWPLLGHLPLLMLEKDHLKLYAQWCNQFKAEGLFKVDAGTAVSDSIVILVDAEYAKTVLSKPELFVRFGVFKRISPLFGDSLLTVEGEEHRYQKKILSKAFILPQMRFYLPVVKKHGDIMIRKLKDLVKNGNENGLNVAVEKYFSFFTFDVIGELGFGIDFNTQNNEYSLFSDASSCVSGLFQDMRIRVVCRIFPFMFKVIRSFGKFKSAHETCKSILDQVLKSREEKIKSGTLTENEKKDVLSMMINEIDEDTNTKMTADKIKGNILGFLNAGRETTAKSLSWLTHCFAKYPEFTQRAKQEIHEKLLNVEEISFDDLNLLTFTNCFIKECFRHYGVIAFNARKSVSECVFGKYTFPKDTFFMIPQFYLNSNGNYDEDFYPDRYIDNDKSNGTSFVFGYGPYSCVGKNLALLEIKYAAVQLLLNFSFSLDPEFTDYKRRSFITITPCKEIMVRMRCE